MTQCHCAIYFRPFQTTNLSWHFRNREAGDVASYLKGKGTSHKPLREYINFHLPRHLKMANLPLRLKWLRVSILVRSCSVQNLAEWSCVQAEIHQIVLSQSVQLNVKTVFPNEIRQSLLFLPLVDWSFINHTFDIKHSEMLAVSLSK
jgi:hypothetical protein